MGVVICDSMQPVGTMKLDTVDSKDASEADDKIRPMNQIEVKEEGVAEEKWSRECKCERE